MQNLRSTRILSLWLLLIALGLGAMSASAQTAIDFEWARWDADITITDDTTMRVAETQQIDIFSGSIGRVARDWTQPVSIQNVFIVDSQGNPTQLSSARSGEQAGSYVYSENGGLPFLTVYLPARVQAGDSVIMQINYETELSSEGIIDWEIVPGAHDAVVQSSTARITFPQGQVPPQSLARVVDGSAQVSIQGSTATVTSTGAIPAGQAVAFQSPFGIGIGAANNNSVQVATARPAAATARPAATRVPAAADQGAQGLGGIDLGTCVPIIVILLLVVVGGGRGLGGLLGGLLGGGRSSGGGLGGGLFGGGGSGGSSSGGGLGGLFGGGRSSGSSSSGRSSGGSSSGSSSGSGRGFRQSSGGRSLPSFRPGKRGGGGGSVG